MQSFSSAFVYFCLSKQHIAKPPPHPPFFYENVWYQKIYKLITKAKWNQISFMQIKESYIKRKWQNYVVKIRIFVFSFFSFIQPWEWKSLKIIFPFAKLNGQQNYYVEENYNPNIQFNYILIYLLNCNARVTMCVCVCKVFREKMKSFYINA